MAADVDKSKQGEEVFTESKSLLFKTLRVRRVYDSKTNTALYVRMLARPRARAHLCVPRDRGEPL